MKKFLCCFVVLTLLISGCLPVMASEGKVEISFCVGDETLIINGTPVTVEKPYVVGEGVTLVPVRVITEAFDAKVDWVAETQTVKLAYPDVNIAIQIGNPVAEVNGRAETLLAPPELTANGYTMVPLRFISENFGAEVSYDNDTRRITVIKEKTGDSSISIEGAVNSKNIGDSYYKWSMENPMNMTMEYRDFDGMSTYFVDGDNDISIDIYTYDKEDYDFESDYNETKMSTVDFTLVKTEKDTSDENCKSFHFGLKDKQYYYDYYQYVTPEYIYVASGSFLNEDTKTRDKYLNLMATFTCKFTNEETYDLSNVKDGYKKFESEELKLSFNVPQNFYMTSSEDSQNRFEFEETENGISSVLAVVYSKSDVGSAMALAAEDYNHNKGTYNEKLVTFSDAPASREYGNISAVEYSYTIKSTDENSHTRDVFFELGEYVYNVSVTVELPNDNYENIINQIIESVKAESLKSEEIGVLMKNMPVATGQTKAKIGKSSMQVPNIYVKMAGDDSSLVYIGPINGVVVTCVKLQAANVTSSELKSMVSDAVAAYKTEGAEVIKALYERTLNKQKYYSFRVKVVEDGETMYLEQLTCLYKGNVYLFTVACSELTYSESTQAEIAQIIESIEFE